MRFFEFCSYFLSKFLSRKVPFCYNGPHFVTFCFVPIIFYVCSYDNYEKKKNNRNVGRVFSPHFLSRFHHILRNLLLLYGVSGVLLGGGLKWNLGDGKLVSIVFANVRKLFGEGDSVDKWMRALSVRDPFQMVEGPTQHTFL